MLSIDIFGWWDAFDPGKHPRGNPKNKGEFVKKGAGSAAAGKSKGKLKQPEYTIPLYFGHEYEIHKAGTGTASPEQKAARIKALVASQTTKGVAAFGNKWLGYLSQESGKDLGQATPKEKPISNKVKLAAETEQAKQIVAEKQQSFGKWEDGAHPEVAQTLNWYTHGHARQLNRMLRGQQPITDLYRKRAALMDMAFASKNAFTKEPVNVYRTVAYPRDFTKGLQEALARGEKPVIENAGYSSTSLRSDLNTYDKGGDEDLYRMHIALPKGANALLIAPHSIEKYQVEAEVLLPRETRLQVSKIERKPLADGGEELTVICTPILTKGKSK